MKYKTTSGRNARIVCTDRKGFGGKVPVLALVEDDGGNEIGCAYNEDLTLYHNQHFPDEDMTLIVETNK